jgi:hypothetical protein
MKIRPLEVKLIHVGGRTDRYDDASSLVRNSAKAPNNGFRPWMKYCRCLGDVTGWPPFKFYLQQVLLSQPAGTLGFPPTYYQSLEGVNLDLQAATTPSWCGLCTGENFNTICSLSNTAI